MAERVDAAHGDTAHGNAAHGAAAHGAAAHGGTETGHRHERPEDWGWHGAWGKTARIGGWFCVVVLCLMNVTTYYNTAQAPWLYGTAGILALILIRDRYTRKNAWRDE